MARMRQAAMLLLLGLSPKGSRTAFAEDRQLGRLVRGRLQGYNHVHNAFMCETSWVQGANACESSIWSFVPWDFSLLTRNNLSEVAREWRSRVCWASGVGSEQRKQRQQADPDALSTTGFGRQQDVNFSNPGVGAIRKILIEMILMAFVLLGLAVTSSCTRHASGDGHDTALHQAFWSCFHQSSSAQPVPWTGCVNAHALAGAAPFLKASDAKTPEWQAPLSQVAKLSAELKATQDTVARQQAELEALRKDGPGKATDKFPVEVYDVKMEQAISRIVRISCPGVTHHDVEVELIFNGAIIKISSADPMNPSRRQAKTSWSKRFQFSIEDGNFEFKEDEAKLERGILQVVFRAEVPSFKKIFRFPPESSMSAVAMRNDRAVKPAVSLIPLTSLSSHEISAGPPTMSGSVWNDERDGGNRAQSKPASEWLSAREGAPQRTEPFGSVVADGWNIAADGWHDVGATAPPALGEAAGVWFHAQGRFLRRPLTRSLLSEGALSMLPTDESGSVDSDANDST